MLFAEGKSREYERMMQQKPGFDRRMVKTMKDRDCRIAYITIIRRKMWH